MMTTVKHVARRVGADERSLRRAVQRGAVRYSRLSSRRLDVSDEEERYLRAHWTLLSRLHAALRTEPNVRLAVVFGSLSRGDERSDSDVDLLVDLRDDAWERRQSLTRRLEHAMGRTVELVVLARVRRDNAPLLSAVLRDGRVLVDRDGIWPALKRHEPSIRRAARIQDARQAVEARAALQELLAE
jgi:predicted nucleotidyltransferase